MKKTSSKKTKPRQPQPTLKWQKGNFCRHASFKFILPYQFLLLCKLVDTKPADMLHDFMIDLAGENSNPQDAGKANKHLINYFIAHKYGEDYYSEEDRQQIFQEMNAMGLLFPANGKMKLIDLYADWRQEHHTYWFKKWYRKSRPRSPTIP